MPGETDTRIVEMHFENRQFERNIAKSKKSLDDFKKELDFDSTSKGLKHFFSSFETLNLNGLTSNIQRLTDKFTGLGDVGEFVMSRIRNSIEGAAVKLEGFIKSFTTAQVSVGQSKYDAMNKSVQALIATGKYTEKQAYDVFSRMQQYTDQTSASFQVMSDKLSEFVSVGEGVWESEFALEGIYNMASKAGKGVNEASTAMEIFSKAMGQNYLGLHQWQSLNQSAHIVTADLRQSIVEAAVSTGDLIKKQNKYYVNGKKYGKQIEVTADNLENTLNKKWLSKDTMMALFDKYFNAELDPETSAKAMDVLSKAAERGVLTYEDFTQMSDLSSVALKDLNKRLIESGVATGDLIKKNDKYYTNSKKYGKEVEVTAENLKETLGMKWASKNTIMGALDKYKFADVAYKSAQRALTFADAMNAIKESISTGWMDSFRIIFGDVTQAMELFTDLCERVIDSIDKLKEARNSILRSWAASGGRQNLIDTILGDYGKDVKTGAYGLLDLFDDVGKVIADGFWDMLKIFASGEEQLSWEKDGYKEAWFGIKLRDITKNIKNFVSSIKNFFTEEVKVGDGTKTRLQMIKEIVDGISGVLALAIITVVEVIRFIDQLRVQLQPTIDAVTNFFGTLGTMIYGAANDAEKSKSIRSFFDSLLEVMKPINDAINTVTGTLFELLLTFINWGVESGFFAKAMDFLGRAFKRISGIVNRVAVPIIKFFGDILGIVKELFATNFDPKTVSQFGTKIGKAFDKMLSSIFGVDSVAAAGEKLRAKISEVFSNISNSMPEGVKKVIESVKTWVGTITNTSNTESKSIFQQLWDLFKNGFGAILDFFKNFSLANVVDTVITTLHNVFDKAITLFQDTNLHGVILTILGVASLVQLFKALRNFKKITAWFKDGIGELTDSLKHGFKVRYDDYGDYMLKITAGIAIIIGAIVLLANQPLSGLIQGVVAFGLIMAAILVFNKFLRKDFSTSTVEQHTKAAISLLALSFAIQGIAGAVAAIAKAVEPLGKMSFQGFAQAMGGVIIILGSLFLFAYAMDKFKIKTISMAGLTGIILAISLLVIGISPFAMMSWSGWARSLLGLMSVLAVLTAFSVALKKLEVSTVKLKGLAALAAGIGILVIAIAPFAFMQWAAWARALLGLVAVLAVLTVFALGLKKLEVSSVKLAGLAALAAGIGILVISIAPFALMNWAAWARSLLGLIAVLAILTLFSFGLKKLEISSAKLAGVAGLAFGIGLLVISIVPFALMPWDAWGRSLLGLLSVLVMLTLFATALKKLQISSAKLAGVAGLALGIGLLVLAISPLAAMSWEGWGKAILGLLAVLGLLIIFSYSLKKLDISTAKLAGVASLGLSIGLLIMAISPLGAMSWEAWGKTLIGLLAVLAMLITFSFLLQKLNISTAKLAGVASLGIGIGILILAISPLGAMAWDAWGRTMIGLLAVLAMLITFSFLLQKLKISTAKLAGVASLSIGIGLLILAISPLGKMSWEAWGKTVLGLLSVLAMLITFSFLLQKLHISTAKLAGVAALGVGIGVLINSLKPLAQMSWQGWGMAMLGLLSILAMLTAFAFGLSALKVSSVKMAGLMLLSVGISMLVYSLTPLAKMSWDAWGRSMLGLLAILAMITLFTFAVTHLNLGKGILSSLVNVAVVVTLLLGVVAIVAVLAIALNKVKDVKTETIAAFAGAITLIMLAMAGTILLLSAIPLTGGLKAILIVAAGIAAIVAVLSIVIPLFLNSVGRSLIDFSSKLTLVSTLLQDFSNNMKATDESGIDKADTIFSRLRSLISNLSGFGNYASVINNFSTALFDLGSGLEIFNNHTKNLPNPETAVGFKMVDKFLSYGDQLKNFDTGDISTQIYKLGLGLYAFDYLSSEMGDVSSSKPLTLLKELAGCAGDLQVLSTLGLDQFKGQLAGLGGAMMLYADGAKGITGIEGDQSSNAEKAVELLRTITSSLVEDGGFTLPNIPHEAELGSFGADLAALAGAIIKFNTASQGLGDSTDKAVDLLQFLGGDLKKELTEDNLKAANAFKDSGITPYGLAEFSLDIFALSSAIKNFVDNTQGINDSKIQSAVSALSVFAEIRGHLISQDALIEVINWFTGSNISNNQLTQFGKDIESLGGALKNFAIAVTWGEKEQGSFQNALDALQFLADLKDRLPKIGGLDQLIHGRNTDLNDLAGELVSIGGGFQTFCKSIVDESGNSIVNELAMNSALAALDKIVEFLSGLSTRMPEVPGLIGRIFKGHSYSSEDLAIDIENFGGAAKELVKLGQILTGSGDDAVVIDEEKLSKALDCLDLIVQFTGSLPEQMGSVGGFINDINSIINGEDYGLSNLKTDLGEFQGVCIELINISDKLSGNGEDGVKVDKKAIAAAINTLTTIVNFMAKLPVRMERIGGFINDIDSLINGDNYNIDNLRTDVGTFASICQELSRISACLTGKDGEYNAPTVGDITAATTVLESVMTFVTDLGAKMPTIGGICNIARTFIQGGSYDLNQLRTDLGRFGEICQELSSLGSTLTGENGEAKIVNKDTFDNATAVLDSVTTFVNNLRQKMPSIGGLGNIFNTVLHGSEYSMTNLRDDLKALGDGLGYFNSGLGSDFDPSKAVPAIEMAKSIADILGVFVALGDNAFDAAYYMEGFSGILTALQGSVNGYGEKKTEGIAGAIVGLMATISHAMDTYGDIDANNITAFSVMAEALKHLSEIDTSFNFETVGLNIDSGIAKGITDNTSIAIDAAKQMASACYDAAIETIKTEVQNGVLSVAAAITQMLNENTNLDPTITPVLDLTNMAAGIAVINGWLGGNGQGMTIDTSNANRLAANYAPRESDSTPNQNDIDLSGIYTRMEALGQGISQLGSDVAKMKLVLDTGVVAGAITPYVDEEIGRRMLYEERNN